MPRRLRIRFWLVLMPALCVAAVPAHAEEPAPASGLVIYRDPATGRLAAPPPSVASQAPGGPLQGGGPVVETRGTTRAGGWKASGRFRHTMQATVHPDGAVGMGCVPDRSGETD
jgi:hypothetical protein